MVINSNGWKVTKEKILMYAGLGSFGFQLVAVTIFQAPFRLEFLIGSLALCGVSLAWWGDKK